CYDLHRKETENGNSTCKNLYRCTACAKTINKNLTKRKHTCGEIYCKTCKDYFEPTHQCYMLPVTGDKMKKKLQTYVFFDFECTQDDL
ncbi:hypothetical protein ScPMuIL_005648, partial [Solemya velum]